MFELIGAYGNIKIFVIVKNIYQTIDIFGRMLQVIVHDYNDLPGTVFKATQQRQLLAEVTFMTDDFYPAVSSVKRV